MGSFAPQAVPMCIHVMGVPCDNIRLGLGSPPGASLFQGCHSCTRKLEHGVLLKGVWAAWAVGANR